MQLVIPLKKHFEIECYIVCYCPICRFSKLHYINIRNFAKEGTVSFRSCIQPLAFIKKINTFKKQDYTTTTGKML